jgi:hypothetical protein
MKYEAPKGKRLNKYFMWIEVVGMWWCYKNKKWVNNPEYDASTGKRCLTMKAFRKHLKKFPDIKGKAILINKYPGHNIYG